MVNDNAIDDAIDVLQQLGLKEYEAKCFVGLSRLTDSRGTAKELSEITEVPRTRVYDAIRVLEAQGLVEIQHTSPQQFRAVPLQEATETLRDQYESRVERLDPIESEDSKPVHEVWALQGTNAIANRAQEMIGKGTNEVVLVIGEEALLTDDLVEKLQGLDDDIDILIAAATEELESEIQSKVPDARAFISGLEWLRADDSIEDGMAVGRLLLVDRSSLLVSSYDRDSREEHAVFGTGLKNGLITLARRAMSQGLVPLEDPRKP
jgi:sugar-specific transcriptional regulator TrmB